MRIWIPALLFFTFTFHAMGQTGMPQVREVDENTLYWFLVNRVNQVVVLGLPPERIGRALENKKVTLLLGNEKPPAWAGKARVVRMGGGPMGGVLLLADNQFLVGRKAEKGREVWLIVESPPMVQIIQGYFQAVLGAR